MSYAADKPTNRRNSRVRLLSSSSSPAREHATITSVASDRSDGSLMNAHCGYWSMRSSRHVWTIATDCLRAAAWPFVNGFSEFRAALLVWFVQNLLLVLATLHHCCAGYTGYVQVMRLHVRRLPWHGIWVFHFVCLFIFLLKITLVGRRLLRSWFTSTRRLVFVGQFRCGLQRF